MTKNNNLYTYGEIFAFKRFYNNSFYIWILQQLGFSNDVIRYISIYFKYSDIVIYDKTARGGYFISIGTSQHINRFQRYLQDKEIVYYIQNVPSECKIHYVDYVSCNCPICSASSAGDLPTTF